MVTSGPRGKSASMTRWELPTTLDNHSADLIPMDASALIVN
jgi:hypothetical protein